MTKLTRCRRCDAVNQCGDCHVADQKRAFCWCGHTRAVHHHNLGCLIKGCSRCVLFEEIPGEEVGASA